eukprot:Platyproteum_vivax@DN5897_c0_g1_i1.p1
MEPLELSRAFSDENVDPAHRHFNVTKKTSSCEKCEGCAGCQDAVAHTVSRGSTKEYTSQHGAKDKFGSKEGTKELTESSTSKRKTKRPPPLALATHIKSSQQSKNRIPTHLPTTGSSGVGKLLLKDEMSPTVPTAGILVGKPRKPPPHRSPSQHEKPSPLLVPVGRQWSQKVFSPSSPSDIVPVAKAHSVMRASSPLGLSTIGAVGVGKLPSPKTVVNPWRSNRTPPLTRDNKDNKTPPVRRAKELQISSPPDQGKEAKEVKNLLQDIPACSYTFKRLQGDFFDVEDDRRKMRSSRRPSPLTQPPTPQKSHPATPSEGKPPTPKLLASPYSSGGGGRLGQPPTPSNPYRPKPRTQFNPVNLPITVSREELLCASPTQLSPNHEGSVVRNLLEDIPANCRNPTVDKIKDTMKKKGFFSRRQNSGH